MREFVEQDERGEQENEEEGHERRARELIELLQELRVVLPGVQVLFAFLLTVPFSARFGAVTHLQQNVFFGTLLCTAVATAFLIAPSAHHRILWRKRLREHRLRSANRLTIAGLIFLLPAMTGTIFLISDVIFGSLTAAIATSATAALFAFFWFIQPLWQATRS
jgi:hypothetical protein